MRQIKVLYDYQAFTFQKFGGVSKCFCELISHLPSEIQWEIAIKQSENAHLWNNQLVKDLQSPKLDAKNFLTKKHFLGKGHLYAYFNKCFPWYPTTHNINRNYAIKKIREGDFDIFHPTFFDTYFLDELNKKPFILTIHDMMPELFSDMVDKNNVQVESKCLLAKKAQAIIAVSEQTKKDIVRILGINPNKIIVIYHGGPMVRKCVEKRIVETPYFLYVGMRGAYKNFSLCLKDFAKFTFHYPDIKLICVGTTFTAKEQKLIRSLNLDNVVVRISATDTELSNLYTYSLGFIYPSLYEGFGMPILEAYAHGCPVLLNNKSCFPEIASDSAIFFQLDEQKQTMVDALKYVINLSNSEMKLLKEKQYERLSHFSWSKSANMLAELYNDIAL